MARGKVRNRDIANNMIDTNKVINGSLQIGDLKIQDTGDSTAVVAETIPYEYNVPGTSIWDKIEAIIAATGFTFDKWTSNTIQTDYVLAGAIQIDITKLLLVFYNGQLLKEGAGDDYEIITTTNPDDTIQLKWTPETGYEIYCVFEKL